MAKEFLDVKIKVLNEKEAKKLLNNIAKGFVTFKIPFDLTIIMMHKSWGDSFRFNGRGGRKWKANSATTRIIKKGSNPLRDDVFLQGSLTGVTTGSVVKKKKQTLELGTTVPYANIQDKGGVIQVTQAMRKFMAGRYGIILGKQIKIDARPFMFFQKKDIKQIKLIFQAYLQGVVDKNAN